MLQWLQEVIIEGQYNSADNGEKGQGPVAQIPGQERGRSSHLNEPAWALVESGADSVRPRHFFFYCKPEASYITYPSYTELSYSARFWNSLYMV